MAKETAKNCLLYIGGAETVLTSYTTISLTVSGATITLADSGSHFTAIAKGDLVTVAGFTDNGDFVAVVKTAAAGSLTLVNPIDPDTRADVTLASEIAGDTVTVTYQHFTALLGQKNTTYQKQASEIDTSDKTSGNWGSSLPGTTKMTVSVSGQILFTGDGAHGGWTALSDAMDSGDTINARLVLNTLGDSYYGPFSLTNQSGGGDDNSVNGYDFTMSVAARPVYAEAVI
ncbi:hypothetical protein H261_03233 [Paramagnetospirillum caucaseum]|uniref:Uncharacterized protein n=1 Tax=Paramagnetospirillum caucaseum TaxID=1244869 RepID=M3AFN9_9PROT|nr:phage tail tube protein [Paramagnetospirillum caucaseum]EME71389.1 hypothetical protein H261_03233 [Paramagnetospirillum caucaseum]